VAATPAQAGAKITSLFAVDPNGARVTELSDESVEYALRDGDPSVFFPSIDENGNFVPAATLEIGDILRGIMSVSDINYPGSTQPSIDVGDTADNTNSLSILFQTKIVDVREVKDSLGKVISYTYVFGPDPGFLEAQALGIAAGQTGVSGGAMALFYEDKDDDFLSNGPINDNIATVTDGDFFWALGFTAPFATGSDFTTAGEGWVASSAINSFFDALGNPAIEIGTDFGIGRFALNRLYSTIKTGLGDGVVLGPRRDTLLTGSGFVEVTGLTTFGLNGGVPMDGWPLNDSTDFRVNVLRVVPVPAAAWMGFALLGALGLGRRLRRRK
jgi:hypothetical protein